MRHFSEKELCDIRESSEFQDEYQIYKESSKPLQELAHFVDSIKLNSKYFRLTMNTHHRGRRHRNRNLGEDTIAIKEINSYLNKLTDKTLDKMTLKIQERLSGREYLREMIFQSVIDKCLLYTMYIPSYLQLLIELHKDTEWISHFVKLVEKSYHDLIHTQTNQDQSEYLQFCDKNKRLDKLIGHSLLILECEKRKMVENQVHPRLDEMLKTMKTSEEEERYKCVQCLYSVLKELYGESELPEGYRSPINVLITSESSMKIKFKMMDILERR